mgnify:CR=1 FL=1
MTCAKCGCYIPNGFTTCPSCEAHKSLTDSYDTVTFEILGTEYTCKISSMIENKDGTISFRMKSVKR